MPERRSPRTPKKTPNRSRAARDSAGKGAIPDAREEFGPLAELAIKHGSEHLLSCKGYLKPEGCLECQRHGLMIHLVTQSRRTTAISPAALVEVELQLEQEARELRAKKRQPRGPLPE